MATGPLAVPDVTRIGVKIAGALHTAHQRDVLHRDVKPENILITDFGEPALADFGISTLAGGAATGLTSAYTPSHAAPEVLRGQPADVRSDVYTLGSTLYHLLRGAPAFGHTGATGLAQFVDGVLNQPPPSLQRDDLPEPVRAAVLAAMAKDPDQRPQSAQAFGQLLQQAQYAAGLPITEMVIGPVGAPTRTDHPTSAWTPGAAPGSTPVAPPGSRMTAPGAPTAVAPGRSSGPGSTPAPAAGAAAGATILPPAYAGVAGPEGGASGAATVFGGRPMADVPTSAATPARSRNRTPLMAAAAVAALAVGAGGAWLVVGRGTSATPAAAISTSAGAATTTSTTTAATTPPTASTAGSSSAAPASSSAAPTLPAPPAPTTRGSVAPRPTSAAPAAPPAPPPAPASTAPAPPSAVTDLYAAPKSGGEISLVWRDSASPTVVEYRIYRSTESGPATPVTTIARNDGYRCGTSYPHCFVDTPRPA